MQRRRSTPLNNTAALFTSPTVNDQGSYANTSTSNHVRSGRPTNAAASSPYADTPLIAGGIELHERTGFSHHGTSSGISLASGPTATYRQAYSPPSLPTSATYLSVSHPALIMKPIVSAVQAWSCFVISLFAIIILSILGLLFKNNHHEMVGGVEDPEDGPAVAGTIFVAVLVYAGFLVFCGLQGLLHMRENRRGAIALS